MRFALALVLPLLAAAHPGHNVREEALERRQFLDTAKRADLSHCADKLQKRGVSDRAVARREAALHRVRQKREWPPFCMPTLCWLAGV
jgi:hypothetical protein